MATQATLVFTGCAPENRPDACIEYSWVPTGQRHVIELKGQAVGTRTDRHSDVTHVQVYSLRSGRFGQAPSSNGWQFPPGPPPSGTHLVSATVVVAGEYAYGTAVYDDGSASTIDIVQLHHVQPFKCGQDEAE